MTEASPTLGARRTLALLFLVLVAFLPAWPGGFLVEDWTFLKRYREWTVAQTVAFELGRPLKDRAWVERERPDFFSTALWRPIPYILAHVEQRAFDDWTGGWLLTRIACHAGTAWLFAAAVLAWTRDREVAWLAGAFYGLHPSRFYPLLVMCQSQMLLAALGAVAALWGVGVWRAGHRGGAVAVVGGAILACGSYEQAVAVIVCWPVLDALTPTPTGPRPTLRAAAARGVPIAAVVLAYVILRVIRFEGFGGYTSLADNGQLFDPARPMALLRGGIVAMGSALVSLAAPVSRADWTLQGAAGAGGGIVPVIANGLVGGATIALLLRRARARWRRAAWGTLAVMAFTAWTVLPVAGILSGHVPWNRYIYFPGFAWVCALAWAVRPHGRGWRSSVPAAVALGCAVVLAWWGCGVWRAAWKQTHGLRAALDAAVPEDRVAYVYLDGFAEWVGGRNLFIRNLDGPIDVGRNAYRLRAWPAQWSAPPDNPVPPRAGWPFLQPPVVRRGVWQSETATLTLEPAPAYAPGTPGDRRTWDLRTHAGRRAWAPGPFLAPIRGGAAGLSLRVQSPFGAIRSPALDGLGWTPAVLSLDMTVRAQPAAPDWVEILFYTPHQSTAAPTHTLRVRTIADGAPHRYVIALLDHPVPALRGPLTRIAIRPSRHEGARVDIREVSLAAAAAGPPPSQTVAEERRDPAMVE